MLCLSVVFIPLGMMGGTSAAAAVDDDVVVVGAVVARMQCVYL